MAGAARGRATRHSLQLKQQQEHPSSNQSTRKHVHKKDRESEGADNNGRDSDHLPTMGQLDDLNWSEEDEIVFYKALLKYKPLGINRHFNFMLAVHELITTTGREFTLEFLWDHVKELYCLEGLESLDESRSKIEQMDFELPDEDFKELKEKKFPTNDVPKKTVKPSTTPTSQTSSTTQFPKKSKLSLGKSAKKSV